MLSGALSGPGVDCPIFGVASLTFKYFGHDAPAIVWWPRATVVIGTPSKWLFAWPNLPGLDCLRSGTTSGLPLVRFPHTTSQRWSSTYAWPLELAAGSDPLGFGGAAALRHASRMSKSLGRRSVS